MKKPFYKRYKGNTSSIRIDRMKSDSDGETGYIHGVYINAKGHAVRIWADPGNKCVPPFIRLDMVYKGYRYYLSQERPFTTTDRGYAMIAAKFIRDVISGKIYK